MVSNLTCCIWIERLDYSLFKTTGQFILRLPDGTSSSSPDEFAVRYRIGMKLLG